jgi:hypothetical protein
MFGENQGVANPVTDLGYGALIGIIITGGLLVQLRSPPEDRRPPADSPRRAGAPSVPLAEDDQNLVPGLIVFLVVGVLIGVALSSVDCPTCP